MDSKEFKNVFGEMAITNGFSKAFGGWIKESTECIIVLELQKSNFGDYFMLNIKVFIQGVFGLKYLPNKDLIKSPMGDITNQVREKDFLNFDILMDDSNRKQKLEKEFEESILPFTNKVLSKAGINELAKEGKIFLLPALKKELDK